MMTGLAPIITYDPFLGDRFARLTMSAIVPRRSAKVEGPLSQG